MDQNFKKKRDFVLSSEFLLMINPPKIPCAPKPAAKRVTLKFPGSSEKETIEKISAEKVVVAETLEIPVSAVESAVPAAHQSAVSAVSAVQQAENTVVSVKSEQAISNPVTS